MWVLTSQCVFCAGRHTQVYPQARVIGIKLCFCILFVCLILYQAHQEQLPMSLKVFRDSILNDCRISHSGWLCKACLICTWSTSTFPGPGLLPSPGKIVLGSLGPTQVRPGNPGPSEVGSSLRWQPDRPLRAKHTQLSSCPNPRGSGHSPVKGILPPTS